MYYKDYDDKGRCIRYEYFNGYVEEYTYDDKDNIISVKDSLGYTCYMEYYDNGKMSESTHIYSDKLMFMSTYDKNGILVSKK